MRRRLFTIASIVSLLVCVATVVLWVRSQSVLDSYTWSVEQGRGRCGVASVKSEVQFFSTHIPDVQVNWERPGFHTRREPELQRLLSRHFFPKIETSHSQRPYRFGTVIYVPHWLLAVLFSILPAASVIQARPWSRHAAGHCRACNYNLTGNTSGVCPECGAACKAADPAGVSPAAGD